MKICIVGLGKLGAPMAAVFASRGYEVRGVDLDPQAVRALNEGRSPVDETGLAEMIAANTDRLSATTEISEAVRGCDASFVIVPTPSDERGVFTPRYVVEACEGIGRGLRARDGYHLVVVTSTLMPGDTGGVVRTALEGASGKTMGPDFGLCYSPEFIALGSVIRDMLHPDQLIIGECDRRAGDALEDIYRRIHEQGCPVTRMGFVNAELAKIAVNTYVTTKISFANMLANLCEALPGADVDAVTRALGQDKRIGPRYLKGALAYGGPCFPRDNRAFAVLAADQSVKAHVAEATERQNLEQTERLHAAVSAALEPDGAIAVLGLSYKTETAVVDQSPGLLLARALARSGKRVRCHDPAAGAAARSALPTSVAVVEELEAALDGASVVVVTMPWPQYRRLGPGDFRPKATIFDCWRVMAESELSAAGHRVVALGRGPRA